MPNAYEILHVAREADPDEIRRAYRKAALAYHPDRHPPSAKLVAEKSFKEVAQAYAILSDAAHYLLLSASRKRGYDRMLILAESTFRPTPPAPPPPTTSTAIATRAQPGLA
ncbi:hypothetical protein CROQUDRAFT_191260 [Cronartium quercuum f. sp. fusiforme G11]|uniref:J domain-containing protein n=1 Tax=Cronartium quercuum f. sp. fusiforme G11 TaxID=708437 RepID=A0A9P6NFH6_9BASI|nr:hypothetical protein CROQUDRAFT_191260 [Cronartium quercuum f. sp. fusiforme G11]